MERSETEGSFSMLSMSIRKTGEGNYTTFTKYRSVLLGCSPSTALRILLWFAIRLEALLPSKVPMLGEPFGAIFYVPIMFYGELYVPKNYPVYS